MAFIFSKIFKKAKEEPDSQPSSAKINFQRSLSLEERVNMAVRAAMDNQRIQELMANDKTGFDDFEEEDQEFVSEHELVRDPVTGNEVTKTELSAKNQARLEFDKYVESIKASKKAEPKKEAKKEAKKESNKEEFKEVEN